MLTLIRNRSGNCKRFYTSNVLDRIYDPIPVLGKGCVQLIDHMPGKISAPLFCDAAVPQMARISYGEGTKQVSKDSHLIRYLMKHYHTSPFEGVKFKFRLKIPIFVERQLIRHRTANVNQISGRYSVLPEEYYVPNTIRKQSSDNKQGSKGYLNEAKTYDKDIAEFFRNVCENSYRHKYYRKLLEKYNIARELARIILPQNIFTELYWVIDLHNLLHFLRLRQDSLAQEEIREVANAIMSIVEKLCPISTQAFLDYRVNTITFSAEEIKAIQEKSYRKISSKRELKEFKKKIELLGIQ